MAKNKPWLSGNPRNKDGKFGKAHRNIFHWDVVKEADNDDK